MKAGSVSRDHATHLTNLGLALAKHKRHREAAATLEDACSTWEDVGSTGINAGKAIKVRARRTEELLHAGDVAAALARSLRGTAVTMASSMSWPSWSSLSSRSRRARWRVRTGMLLESDTAREGRLVSAVVCGVDSWYNS